MARRLDVVVVGAGLAGLQTARLLGLSGLRVLLVDRKSSPDQTIHTTGIFVRKTLEDFALPDDWLGPPVRRVVLYSPARRPLALSSNRDEFRVGRMASLYRRLLDSCLRAGVEWAGGTRYISSAPHYSRAGSAPRHCPTGSPLEHSGSLVELTTKDRVWRVETRFLIGADGASSRVARDLGLDVNRELLVGVEEVYDAATGGEPTFHCFLDARLAPGYLAWVVDDGVEVHVGLGGMFGRFHPAQALARFKEDLIDTGRRVEGTKVAKLPWGDILRPEFLRERRGGRIPVGGILPRIANERGLVVGDAAGAPSPLTAGGLDPCLRLSGLAAQVAAGYVRGGDPVALQVYRGDRFRPRFTSRLFMRRLLDSFRHPLWLEAACAALRLPGGRQLAWHVFFGRGSFPDVELSAPALDLTRS